MAGIYLHIPFCKTACIYCDFHFSTQLNQIDTITESLCKEIALQKHYLGENTQIETIYFGGGTPSIIGAKNLGKLFKSIEKNFPHLNLSEVTLETNPDDLNNTALKEFKTLPINRFSIGVQSFFDQDLTFMKRAHNAMHAEDCIKRAQDFGFENLTIDLIYGLPTLTDDNWKENLDRAMALNIPHLSCYSLTVEEKTELAFLIKNKKLPPLEESRSINQFGLLMEKAAQLGYEHYEISNFGLPGHRAIHNSNYWKGIPYLGIGPSAHSYNGSSRSYNARNNAVYIKHLNNGELPQETEFLSKNNMFNETIMIGLRTIEGINLALIERKFGYDYKRHTEKESSIHITFGNMEEHNGNLRLTNKGKFLADKIASDLFILDQN